VFVVCAFSFNNLSLSQPPESTVGTKIILLILQTSAVLNYRFLGLLLRYKMGKIIMKRKFVRLKIDGRGLFEVHSSYRYGLTEKKQERPQPEKEGNKLDHNHKHFKY
jgi:hypothetical protein